jgi:hypothetical protein
MTERKIIRYNIHSSRQLHSGRGIWIWNHLAVAGPAGVLRRPFLNLKVMYMKQQYLAVQWHRRLYQKGKGNEWVCARVLKATTRTTKINQITSADDDNITCMWLIDMNMFALAASIHNGRTCYAGSWRAKDSMINNPLEYLNKSIVEQSINVCALLLRSKHVSKVMVMP